MERGRSKQERKFFQADRRERNGLAARDRGAKTAQGFLSRRERTSRAMEGCGKRKRTDGRLKRTGENVCDTFARYRSADGFLAERQQRRIAVNETE